MLARMRQHMTMPMIMLMIMPWLPLLPCLPGKIAVLKNENYMLYRLLSLFVIYPTGLTDRVLLLPVLM
jgi:hypothetical protein